jgi:hypothetical protein
MEAPHEEQKNLELQFNHNNEPLQTTRDSCVDNFSTSMQLSNTPRTPECTQWNRTLEYHCDQSNSIVYITHNQNSASSNLTLNFDYSHKKWTTKAGQAGGARAKNEELVGTL